MPFHIDRRSFLSVTWLALGLLATAPHVQAATNYVLKVTPDHANALYQQGETVSFKVELTLDKQPVTDAEVQWTLTKDGMPPSTSGKAKLVNGTATVTGKLDEPGFLSCRATFAGPEKLTFTALGGAGVDPLKIKPSQPVPADFDAFWAAQKKLLAAVPVNARLAPVKSPTMGVEMYDLQADSVGAPVSGYFARPEKAQPKSLPIILTVHGAGVRSSSLGSAANWAKQNFLALDINAHGLPNGKPDEFYKALSDGDLKDYRARGRESRETVYFRGMFLRLVRALDYLTAQPEWDGKTVVVSGSSQGGYQAIVAAGLDARVTFFAAGVPAGCDHTGLLVKRINGWPKFIPSPAADQLDPKVVEAVRYYDAMNFATRTKAGAVFTVGFIDTTCPPTSVYAAYNNVSGAKSIHNDPESGHTVTSKAGEAMRKAILEHVKVRAGK
ncbi:MAG: acetylxylan esterase [Proteobacteria bacterium]|nr:acetylxylan esterase [Pseudomonadota bacterium]